MGAIARDGSIASYVNRGQAVDLSAPGGDDPVPADPQNNPPNGIRTLTNLGISAPVPSPAGDALIDIQGTSFATAQASAVASLMLAVNGSLSPDTMETLLRLTTRAFPDSSCNTNLCGTGVLDASAALAAAADPASVLGIGINEGGGGGGCMLARSSFRFDPLLIMIVLVAGIRGLVSRMKAPD